MSDVLTCTLHRRAALGWGSTKMTRIKDYYLCLHNEGGNMTTVVNCANSHGLPTRWPLTGVKHWTVAFIAQCWSVGLTESDFVPSIQLVCRQSHQHCQRCAHRDTHPSLDLNLYHPRLVRNALCDPSPRLHCHWQRVAAWQYAVFFERSAASFS